MLQFLFATRNLIDVIALCVVVLAQALCARSVLRRPAARKSKRVRTAVIAGWAGSMAMLALWFVADSPPAARVLTHAARGWIQGSVVLWAVLSLVLIGCYVVTRGVERLAAGLHDPARRRFLGVVRCGVFGVPTAALGYGTFILRHQLRVRQQDIPIAGLPEDLNGLRLAQLTDIHLSPFLSVRELERAVEMANETKPHVTLVTGDLITMRGDPLDDCLHALKALKADAGVFGCLGNHEIYAHSEDYTQREGARIGITFLRRQTRLLKFGAARLNLAGIDYQRLGKHYLVGAEQMVEPGAFNVLLQHNPDVFPVAAAKGFPLTISGHTHGGQVKVEILRADLNISRFYTHYVDGLYQKDGSSIFVSRGIGTIALPTRLGAPPEVAFLRLVRT